MQPSSIYVDMKTSTQSVSKYRSALKDKTIWYNTLYKSLESDWTSL